MDIALNFDFFFRGGIMMYPMLAMTFMLWYFIGHRFFVLRGNLVGKVRMVLEELRGKGHLDRDEVSEVLIPIREKCAEGESIVTTIVLIAPLVGLLGTVMGMIETFESLGDMSLFSQSGGIAGGIGQALITTQMGLAIAIPGLLIGRVLKQKEIKIIDEIDQIEVNFTKEYSHEV